MYSLKSALQVIFISLLVATIANSAHGRPQDTRNILYSPIVIRNAPYTMQLRDENGVFFCAGALVAPKFVVTAAECFDNVDHTKTTVVGGAQTLTAEGVQRQITQLNPHPDYETTNKFSNVAVLTLNEPFPEGTIGQDNITTIALSTEAVEEQKRHMVAGWRQLYNKDLKGDTFYFTLIPVASQDKCEQEFNLTPRHNAFCEFGHGYDDQYAINDLGGPTVRGRELAGITTSCHNCDSIDYAVSYTSVYEVRAFIESVMNA